MDIHEYQAGGILAGFGVPVPRGGLAFSPEPAGYRAREPGGDAGVVKAKIHSGARGAADGVRLCRSEDAMRSCAATLFGRKPVTRQTDAAGKRVHRVRVEGASDIRQELCLGLVRDRKSERIMIVASVHGGMEIEELAENDPDSLPRMVDDPAVGPAEFQARELAFSPGLSGGQVAQMLNVLHACYRACRDLDAMMVEIDPLVITRSGDLVALDAKMALTPMRSVAVRGSPRAALPPPPDGDTATAILIDDSTRVLVQGIFGCIGQFHTCKMIEAGRRMVAGVIPGKGGTSVPGRPVFDTVREAVDATGADASLLFVPPPIAADAMMEAADAAIRTAVRVTDGIPAQDMIRVKRFLRRYSRDCKMRLIGPNCAGVISSGTEVMGIMPPHIHMPGRVGIVGRSGTPGYEAARQMHALGTGGDPINGSSFRDILELFETDPDTDAVMMIGEIGCPQEADAAALVRDHMARPVVASSAGLSTPRERRMGHAGAIILAFGESAREKVELPSAVGITVAPNPSAMGATMAGLLGGKRAA